MKGKKSDWNGLPFDKSLFHSPEGCGLPIGNLTSQLFSNVYLNVLDQFMKRELKCRHYGRYVDDFYVVSADREWLLSIIPMVKSFLMEQLRLDFHDGKLKITSVWHGVEFLGAWLKPHRIYASRNCTGRIDRKLAVLALEQPPKWYAALNSYCGLLSHWNNFNVKQAMMLKRSQFIRWGMFDYGLNQFYDLRYLPCSPRSTGFAIQPIRI